MSYNLIPADFGLPLSFPTLTLIAASALFTLYVLTLMPRKEKFVVNGRTVIITGGSQGMGKGLAKRLAKKGANVVIVARDVKKLEAALEEIKASAANASTQRFHYLSADVTQPSENERIISEVTTWNNGSAPDIVWANAGSAHPTLFLETPIDTLRSQMDINYWASAYLAHSTLKAWTTPSKESEATGRANNSTPRHFIITSSVVAFCGIAGYSPYSPAKSAIRSLVDTLRSELNLYNGARLHESSPPYPEIKIHCVLPGTILSPGHDHEQTLKHPVTGLLEDGDPSQTGDQVAEAAIAGLEKGGFIITTQPLGHLMRLGALGGSPRNGWLGIRDMLGSWVVNAAWLFIGPDMESKVFKWGKKNGVKADAKAQSNGVGH